MFIYNASHLSIGFQDFFLCIFSLSLVFDFDVSWHRFLCIILFGYTRLLESISLCLLPTPGSFQPFFQIFLAHILSSPSRTLMIQMSDPLLLPHRSLRLFSCLFSLFSLCYSDQAICIVLSSSSLMFPPLLYLFCY